MPNRIIKESAFTSDKISRLSDFEFRLWVGLITQADDAGRGDARPAIIKGRVFALRERVTIKDIDSALHALAAGSCVSLYEVGGKPYYQFPGWAAHQRVRDVKPKYPGPEEGQILTICGNPPQSDADCGLNPIQSNPNPNPNPTTTREAAERGDLGKVMSFYMENISQRTPSSVVTSTIQGYLEDMEADVVIHAMQIAAEQDSRSWKYIKAILDRYREQGLKTMKAVKADEAEYKAKTQKRPKRVYGSEPKTDEEKAQAAERDKKALDQVKRLREKINKGDGE